MTRSIDKSLLSVIIGDGSVGKTCFLSRFCENKYYETYIPSIFENYNKEYEVDGRKMNLRYSFTVLPTNIVTLVPILVGPLRPNPIPQTKATPTKGQLGTGANNKIFRTCPSLTISIFSGLARRSESGAVIQVFALLWPTWTQTL